MMSDQYERTFQAEKNIVLTGAALDGVISSRTAGSVTLCDMKLPPIDSGRGAWTYLTAAFFLETIIWGYASSFGVLMEFYNHPEFSPLGQERNAANILPLVGTVNSGIMALLAPLLSAIISRYPSSRRMLMIIGLIVCGTSLFFSSFANSCSGVFWSQGVGYGVGGSAVYYPALSYLPEWFLERRGLANGILFAGTGLGGLVFPVIVDASISRLGIKLSLQILALSMSLVMGVCLLLIRPRVSLISQETPIPLSSSEDLKKINSGPSQISTPPSGIAKRLERCLRWPLALYLISNTIQATGYYLPGLYLPSYAQSLSLKSSAGSATVAAMNAGTIISRVAAGALSDHFSPHTIGCLTSFGGGASALLIWGLFGNRGWISLMSFAFIFGCTSGAWPSLYFGVITVWLRNPELTMSTYGILSLTRGVGNIIAGPISSSLIARTKHVQDIRTGFDVESYSGMIWFTGIALMVTSSLELILWIIQVKKHKL